LQYEKLHSCQHILQFLLDDHWSNNGNAKAIQERVENMLSAEQAALLSQEQAQMQRCRKYQKVASE